MIEAANIKFHARAIRLRSANQHTPREDGNVDGDDVDGDDDGDDVDGDRVVGDVVVGDDVDGDVSGSIDLNGDGDDVDEVIRRRGWKKKNEGRVIRERKKHDAGPPSA